MGLILDLAVVALALVVIGSLALLAWTLAVSAVAAVRRERAAIGRAHESLTDAERRLHEATARARTALDDLVPRTRVGAAADNAARGEHPDR